VTDATKRQHVIAALSYSLDHLECSCGAVMAAAGGLAWRDHRNSVGLTTPTIGQTIGKRVRPAGAAAKAWNGPIVADRVCGMVLRNRHGAWSCAVPLPAGVRVHAGQHLGTSALAARAKRDKRFAVA
jgi:hypothetical protein